MLMGIQAKGHVFDRLWPAFGCMVSAAVPNVVVLSLAMQLCLLCDIPGRCLLRPPSALKTRICQRRKPKLRGAPEKKVARLAMSTSTA
jgi:hypothetical protein